MKLSQLWNQPHQVIEASLPLGKPVNASGFTFGFEAEFIVSEGYIYESVMQDIDEFASNGGVKLLDEYFSMPNLDYALSEWQEDHPEDDADDMLMKLGAQEFLKRVDATVNNREARYDPETGEFAVHDRSHYDVLYSISDRIQEDLGFHSRVFRDDHERSKEPSGWYVEPDITVKGDDSGDYDAELTSPVFNNYAKFSNDLQSVLEWIGQHPSDWVYTNGTCGLHINIGPPAGFDVIKFLVFAGEDWLAKLFPRQDSQSTQSLIAELRDKAKFARSFDGFIRRLTKQLKGVNDKMFSVNFLPWFEGKKYVEVRVMGGAGYEKRFPEIKQHIDRLMSLFAIASDKQKYRQAYMAKVYRYFIAATPDALVTPGQSQAARMFLQWARERRVPDYVIQRWVEGGKVIATPAQVFELVATHVDDANKPPLALIKLMCRDIGLKQSEIDELPNSFPRYAREEYAQGMAQAVQILKTCAIPG